MDNYTCAICGKKAISVYLFKNKNINKIMGCCSLHNTRPEDLDCYICGKNSGENNIGNIIICENITISYALCSTTCAKIQGAEFKKGNLQKVCICGDYSKFVCSKCRTTRYCSKTCQKEDWKTHKKICQKN